MAYHPVQLWLFLWGDVDSGFYYLPPGCFRERALSTTLELNCAYVKFGNRSLPQAHVFGLNMFT